MSASIKTEDTAAGAATLAASAAAAPGTPAAAGGMPDALRDAIAKAVWDDILNEAVVEVLFDVHRLHKLDRSVCQVCHTKCRVFSSVPGQDVFGCNPSLTNGEKYDCPQCQNQLPAARYAPHLEKCLGLGRMSSRVANRKITAAADRQSSPAATGSVYGEGDSDTDRDTYTDKKKKRKTSPIRRSTVKKAKPAAAMMGSLDPYTMAAAATPAATPAAPALPAQPPQPPRPQIKVRIPKPSSVLPAGGPSGIASMPATTTAATTTATAAATASAFVARRPAQAVQQHVSRPSQLGVQDEDDDEDDEEGAIDEDSDVAVTGPGGPGGTASRPQFASLIADMEMEEMDAFQI